jgi:hypothetical protein
LQDRKRAIYASKEFIGTVDCVIESSSRVTGTPASFTTNLPYAIRGCFSASLSSISIPMNFGTNVYTRSFNVTYTNVGPWPGSFTLPIGYFYYSISAGTVTYTEAQAYPSSNNLLYFILNYFSGALESLTVLPQSGGINWEWDSATGGATSTDVPSFFQLLSSNGFAWLSNGQPIDLSGVKTIGLIIPDISFQNSKSNVVGIPNYFTTIPVSVSYGSVLTYEPIREDVSWFGSSTKDISALRIQVVDTSTNVLFPLVSEWSMVLRFYVVQDQTS